MSGPKMPSQSQKISSGTDANDKFKRGPRSKSHAIAITTAKFTATLASVFLAACTSSSNSAPKIRLLGDSERIFSTAPQINTYGVYIIKLQQPAVLSALKLVDGKKQVDAALLKSVSDEQDALLKKLTAISPDIKLLYRYRMVINAVSVVAPAALEQQIRGVGDVLTIESSAMFSRPVLPMDDAAAAAPVADLLAHNSVKYIGALDAHARGVSGQGMKIGIIDTGIDYTHAMFGGAGTEAAYKAVNPDQPNPAFPSQKVVGGIDLVGTEYDAASADFNKRLPIPDSNPIDEAGHGSHVAGTVAGIGDGKNTYTGVAPDATLYAIKVFGKKGSTGEAVVIAGLEYAADPSGKGDLSGQLDVVNLSLGGAFGEEHDLYTEAVGNLSRGGTVVVCAAGNDGDTEYIVSSPGVSKDAFAVAAMLDDQAANYDFPAVQFVEGGGQTVVAEAIESAMTKPIKDAGDIGGQVIYAGLGNDPFTDDIKAQIKGKVVLLDRGGLSFEVKMTNAAAAGVAGVVVINNAPGEAFTMGGSDKAKFDFPGVMIQQDQGQALVAALKNGPITIHFQSPVLIQKPELIGTIADFSSKGPRSYDALIKPEISAPGSLTISAKMGGGAAGVAMSGTSMATPHMAGVMALLKQTHPDLSSAELKSLAMGTARTLVDNKKITYPVSRQGSGGIQVIAALDAQVISEPTALSLGEVTVESKKILQKTLTLKNISKQDLSLSAAFEGSPAISMTGAAAPINLKAGASQTLTLRFALDVSALTADSSELDGWVKLTAAGSEVDRVPVLAVANKVAEVQAGRMAIRSTSDVDSQGAVVDLSMKNTGVNSGDAYLFNLIGLSGRKQDPTHDKFRSNECDLQGAGYRVIQKNGQAVFQVAVKVYDPMTEWANCQVEVLIDSDGDGVADQELVGTIGKSLPPLTVDTYQSMLLNAPQAIAIRRQFELDTVANKKDVKEDYTKALIGTYSMAAIDHSTVAIVEANVADLGLKPTGELSVQIALSSGAESAIEADDFLIKDRKTWLPLNVAKDGAAFGDLPEKVTLAKGVSQTVSFTKGAGAESLWLLYPQNRTVVNGITTDSQSQVVLPVYDTSLTP